MQSRNAYLYDQITNCLYRHDPVEILISGIITRLRVHEVRMNGNDLQVKVDKTDMFGNSQNDTKIWHSVGELEDVFAIKLVLLSNQQ